MTTEIIILSKPITVKAGTVIPGLYAHDMPLNYDIVLRKDDQLIKSEQYYFGRHQGGGMAFMEPQDPSIVDYLWNIALSNGDIPLVRKDSNKRFKAFYDHGGSEGPWLSTTYAADLNAATVKFIEDYPGIPLIVRE